MNKSNIKSVVKKYTSELNPDHRYVSFDYCYNYCKTTIDPAKDIQISFTTLISDGGSPVYLSDTPIRENILIACQTIDSKD